MRNKIAKILIKPFMDGDNFLSFKLKSNVNIAGFQFRMDGFSKHHYYQFKDVGTVKDNLKVRDKSSKNWMNRSIVDVYNFRVVVNSDTGILMAFSTEGSLIKPGHSHLFRIPIIKNDGKKILPMSCIKDLIVSDNKGNDFKMIGGTYGGGCVNYKNIDEINKSLKKHLILDRKYLSEKNEKKNRIS